MSQQTWTVEKIIEEAAKKGEWQVTPNGLIRRMVSSVYFYECPISCLVGETSGRAADIAERLGIEEVVARQVMVAADNDGYPYVRAQMLSAFGLPAEDREATR